MPLPGPHNVFQPRGSFISIPTMSDFCHDTTELAERYDRISDSQFEKGSTLIRRMGIKVGDQVLDVGCGTGRLTLHVSQIVGPSGCVLGIDLSSERISVANGKLAGHEPKNVHFSVGRAEDLRGLSYSAFDHVYYSSVLHWVVDKPAALKEAFRVLVPGGKIGITTADRDNPQTLQAIMNRVFLESPYAGQVKLEADARQPVNLTELATLLKNAGFQNIDIELHERKRLHPTVEDALQYAESTSAGKLFSHVPESLRTRARQDVAAELEKMRTPDGIPVSNSSLLAMAIKPI